MMHTDTPPSNNPTAPGLQQPPASPSDVLQSQCLFKGEKSVVIEHNGARYRLQSTKLGKLILTK